MGRKLNQIGHLTAMSHNIFITSISWQVKTVGKSCFQENTQVFSGHKKNFTLSPNTEKSTHISAIRLLQIILSIVTILC